MIKKLMEARRPEYEPIDYGALAAAKPKGSARIYCDDIFCGAPLIYYAKVLAYCPACKSDYFVVRKNAVQASVRLIREGRCLDTIV